MRMVIWGALAATQLMTCSFSFAQTNTHSASRTNWVIGSAQPSPVLAVSPSTLDFGLIGVGRSKDLTLKVQNVGGGELTGTATVTAPFVIAGNNYSLRSGQSKSLRVRYMPTVQGTNSKSVVFSGQSAVAVPVTGVARTPPSPPGNLKITSPFTEEETADFIVRYFSDQTSYALKPAVMDGMFRSICDRAHLLNLAKQQPRHELAVVVLIHYPAASEENTTKLAWVNDLKRLGYRRIVFLQGRNTMKVNGLPILEYPQAPTISAGK